MNILLSSHLDLLQSLLKSKVEFLVIGGFAVIYHGYPRTTGDMDIWLHPSNRNKAKFILAMESFGIDAEGLQNLLEKDFTQHLVFEIGKSPERIEFLTRINQVSFEEAYAHKVFLQYDPLLIPIISLDDLILSKINTGRSKDAADVEELQRIRTLKHKT